MASTLQVVALWSPRCDVHQGPLGGLSFSSQQHDSQQPKGGNDPNVHPLKD